MRKKRASTRTIISFAVINIFLLICICVLSVCLVQSKSSNAKYSQQNKDNNIKIEAYKNEINELNNEQSSQIDEQNNIIAELESQNESLSAKVQELESIANANGIKEPVKDDKKVVFLTFDDGPSELTPQFLDTLERYQVNATFFVTYQPQYEDTYKKIIEKGNAIQIHTATHDYNSIYSSVEAYEEDFTKAYDYVCQVTGIKPAYFRFPGGSTNSYGKSIVRSIAKSMADKGFQFVDWNVSVGDGSASATKESIIAKITAESEGKQHVVLLAHDSGTKSETLAALPEIIEYYKNNGYEFHTIGGNVDMSFAQFID